MAKTQFFLIIRISVDIARVSGERAPWPLEKIYYISQICSIVFVILQNIIMIIQSALTLSKNK